MSNEAKVFLVGVIILAVAAVTVLMMTTSFHAMVI
jgi:hypothetical protein